MSSKAGSLWSDYQAFRMNSLVKGAMIPSIEECVLSAFGDIVTRRRSEIVHVVMILTGIDRIEVERNINGVLNKMEKDSILIHSGYNEWRRVQA